MYGSELRVGATCAIVGSVVLFAGTYLHPMHADPNEVVAAFAEYAADPLWRASHLMQLLGMALLVAALLILTKQLEAASDAAWPRLAAGGAIASLAVAAALQAVDGIALKAMVDNWAAAPASQKEVAFQAALAVRQVEIGLASALGFLSGLSVTVCGIALLGNRIYPKWVAGMAILAGVPTTIASVVMAYSGFSGLAMAINMPASLLLLLWMLIVGVFLWRRASSAAKSTAV